MKTDERSEQPRPKPTRRSSSSRPSRPKKPRREPIAIVGMACRFPSEADTPEKFWENVKNGVDSVTEIPKSRWDADAFYDPKHDAPGKCVSRKGAFLDGIDQFDAQFFGIPPRTANLVDPQQRLLLEVSWEALENANLSPDSLKGASGGVFMGLWGVDYWLHVMSRDPRTFNGYEWSGNMHSSASGIISYLLGLQGPAITIDTACSTALVATHLACRHLQTGDCDIAIAGAVNLCLSPTSFVVLSRSKMIAPDGHCKTFDAAADGYTRGEGCGVVVLKRLSDAVRDGDRVLATIRGIAVNADGRNAGMAVPNADAQAAVIRKALDEAGLEPTAVHYVEAHGTGTKVGDPTEMQALAEAYGRGRDRSDPLVVGAVKANIGHLETASGAAALIKTVLVLQNEAIPGNLHFHDPNPAIPWSEIPVEVPKELVPWPRSAKPRFAGVSCFGASGTNAHLILEQAPAFPDGEEANEPAEAVRAFHVLPFSAKSEAALDELSVRYEALLRESPEPSLQDVSRTAATGRAHLRYRRAVVAGSRDEMLRELQASRGWKIHPEPVPLGFLFTGQGSQYPGMGRALYVEEPAFRSALDRCAEILEPHLETPLLDVLFPERDDLSPIDQTAYSQPAIFSIEIALAELLRSWGIAPSMVMGHSIGEYAAAVVAGVFSLEEALRLVAERGRLMQALPRAGKMFSVLATEERVAERINGLSGVRIAAVNGPESVVVSGETKGVESAVAALVEDGYPAVELNVSHAFHSPLMEPMLDDFRAVAESVSYSPPKLPFVSTVSGALSGPEIASPDYWVNQVRSAVRFHDGLGAMRGQGVRAFLEIGPKPTLLGMGRTALATEDVSWLACLQPGVDDRRQMRKTLAELYAHGADVDWKAVFSHVPRRGARLPNYPFQRQRFWAEGNPGLSLAPPGAAAGAGNGPVLDLAALGAGVLGEDESRLVSRLLAVIQEEIARSKGTNGTNGSRGEKVVADYYDSLADSALSLGKQSQSGPMENKTVLNFVPIPERMPGYSWIRALAFPESQLEYAAAILDAQKSMRRVLFRRVDMSRVKRVLDFGCGYGTDLIRLASENPQVEATGLTLSPGQARLGREEATHRGVADRVTIHVADSTKHELPSELDLVLGFEVACHIRDKGALFSNLSRHLREGGQILLADFVARTEFEIAHEATSSYLATARQWATVLADHQIEIVDCIDISANVQYALDDPDFEANFTSAHEHASDRNVEAAFRSYDRMAKMLSERLLSYVLMAHRKSSERPRSELLEANLEKLERPLLYAEAFSEDWTYGIDWVESPGGEARPPERGTYVIAGEGGGLAEEIEAALSSRGDRAVRVSFGSELRRDVPEDAERLLREYVTSEAPLRAIVDLGALDEAVANAAPVGEMTAAATRSCGHALYWTKALARSPGLGGGRAGRLWLVTRGAVADESRPAAVALSQSPVWGLGRVLSLEHPELFGGLVDLGEEPVSVAASLLLGEIDRLDEEQVAFSEGSRRVPRLVRRRVPPLGSVAIRSDATYLVTGGLGALGARGAQWLAAKGARKLVLTGRRGLETEGARDLVRSLQERDCEAVVVAADVAEESGMRLIAETLEALPPLRGILHAAGLSAFHRTEDMELSDLESVMLGKVAGALHLEKLARDPSLDFFVCYSSISSVWGTEGAAHYAAANHFLDAFAHDRRFQGKAVSSVNWGPWAGGGMASEDYLSQLSQLGVKGLEPGPCYELLGRILLSSVPQTIVARMDWKTFKEVYELRGRRRLLERLGAPPASSVASAPKTRVSETTPREGDRIASYLAEKVAAMLGYPDPSSMDKHAPLVELGFDSLMAVRLRNAIRADLGIDVPVGELFVSGSLDALASACRKSSRTPVPPPRVAPAKEETGNGHDRIAAWARDKVGTMLGFTDVSAIDVHAPLVELGFDSLMAVRLRNAIKSDLGLDVPVGELFVSASLARLSELLRAQAPPSPAGAPAEELDVEYI